MAEDVTYHIEKKGGTGTVRAIHPDDRQVVTTFAGDEAAVDQYLREERGKTRRKNNFAYIDHDLAARAAKASAERRENNEQK